MGTLIDIGRQAAAFTHPAYVLLRPVWEQLRDVREGIGGFLDGGYLIGHPREYVQTIRESVVDGKTITETISTGRATRKLKARQKLASYENVAARILQAMQAALCREQPSRRVGEELSPTPQQEPADDPKPTPVAAKKPLSPLEEWWENVDGAGMHIDDFMAHAWDLAGTFGHVHIYMDRAPSPDAETAADESMPFLRVYTPLDALDWLTDDLGRLKAIKFQEIAPRANLETQWTPEGQVRLVDDTEWKLYDRTGRLKSRGPHQMGICPVVTLYAERRPMDQVMGASVLGDPRLYIDLYNLVSETRELLRNQTFGILNVPLGTGEGAMTVTEAQAQMGKVVGTENVLFSGLAAGFIQPSADNVTVYHEEIARKLRTIYRLVGVQWETDSKDAESEGSLKLKREDLNQRLSAFADEMERSDYALAELFYRATLGPERGATAVDDEHVVIKYPDQFDMTPFEALIAEAQAARDLGMGATFMKELRKMLLGKFTGMADLPESVKAQVVKEIEAAPADLTPAEQAQQRLDLTMTALKGGKQTVPDPLKPKGKAA